MVDRIVPKSRKPATRNMDGELPNITSNESRSHHPSSFILHPPSFILMAAAKGRPACSALNNPGSESGGRAIGPIELFA